MSSNRQQRGGVAAGRKRAGGAESQRRVEGKPRLCCFLPRHRLGFVGVFLARFVVPNRGHSSRLSYLAEFSHSCPESQSPTQLLEFTQYALNNQRMAIRLLDTWSW